MKTPQPIVDFTALLEAIEPSVQVSVDAPDLLEGEFFLDVAFAGFATEVSYRSEVGFGLFVSDGEFGQKPDEIFKSPQKAAIRIQQLKQLFEAEGRLAPLGLADLRALLGLTQVQLAASLGVTQPTVQRAEKQPNPQLESIAGFVAAMGGRLETKVVFGDMEARLDFPRVTA